MRELKALACLSCVRSDVPRWRKAGARWIVARSIGLAHIIRQDDGTSTGTWGVHTLKTAFQPIFAFEDGRLSIVAFEGLIRPFRDDEAVSPLTFFSTVPLAERLHVETLTRTLHLLNASACLDTESSLFINFDPSIFGEKAVVDIVLRDMRLVLHETGIDPARIVCEVTEQRSASEDALYRFVQALRLNGFRIAIDDFGAADSDINRVRGLSPDIVKFDAHWITHLMESGPGFTLLKAMVSAFTDQGIRTVFEGIEEGWQLELAEKSGAAMVQGYVLARPVIVPVRFDIRKHGSEPAGPETGSATSTHAVAGRRSTPARKVFGRRNLAS